MRDRRPAFWWLALVMLVVPGGGHAQWWVDLGVGKSSHDAIAPQLDTDDVSIALRSSGTNWLEVAAGIPLGSSGSAWGSVAAGGRRVGSGQTAFGVAANGQLFARRERAGSGLQASHGALIEATPLLRLDVSFAQVELRTGVMAVWNDFEGRSETRWVPSSWLVAERALSGEANLQATGRLIQADGDASAFAGLSATYDSSGWGAWSRVGRWFSGLERESEWSAGAYFRAVDRLQLYGSVHRDADDPVYDTVARLSWSLGASYALWPGTRAVPEPVPLELPGDRVAFRIRRGEAASTPSIAGDFTGWSPLPMLPEEDGWVAHFQLAPGLYRFAFIDAKGNWFLPPSVVHRVSDSFGGENGVLVVR